MPAVRAWAPRVPGIAEVFHAWFTDHAYPEHTHDTWTLLVVDEGAIRYDLDRHEHGALRPGVTLLPPHVAHTGRAATPHGFRKRVLYLDAEVLDTALIGPAVDAPALGDPLLRTRVHQLHRALEAAPGAPVSPAGSPPHISTAQLPAERTGEPPEYVQYEGRLAGAPSRNLDPPIYATDSRRGTLEAESRLALIADRIRQHLRAPAPPPPPDRLATDLRDLLDARMVDGLALREAGALLHTHPAHLVRSFTKAYGLPPHRYLTGRRVAAARRRLLGGEPAAQVAVGVGFHDQAHLHRHFTRLVGTTPGRYARGAS